MNCLKMLGKSIPQSEVNRKILRSMPWSFVPKFTTLEDSVLIETMSTLALFTELEEFEMKLKHHNPDSEVVKFRNLALKSSTEESSLLDSDNESDEELACISRKIRNLMQKKNKLK